MSSHCAVGDGGAVLFTRSVFRCLRRIEQVFIGSDRLTRRFIGTANEWKQRITGEG